MPTLEWIGKDKVVNHHQEVPYRVLERQYSYDEAGQHTEDNGSENMIIHGDNLEALKALLPRYEGKVKCIYIDPPYNTGNEGWVYNDNVNDPKIKKWLGEVVGREGEDLSRHDKWLCMMYPRLKLLQRLLAEDGFIFVSIDVFEYANLKCIMDEIFGVANFRNCISVRRGIKTGDKDELKNVDLLSQDCPIRYIITVNALKEGWDCPFAYVLATVANRPSTVDVEQILGRVLRLPYTQKNSSEVLNLSYVITSSADFHQTLEKVVAGLNSAGFSSRDYRAQDVDVPITTAPTQEPEQLPLVPPPADEPDLPEVDGSDLKARFEAATKEAEQSVQDGTMQSAPMLSQALQQNKTYEDEINQADNTALSQAPSEVRNKMNQFRMNEEFADEAAALRFPQFMLETGPSLFSEAYEPLELEHLEGGFSLRDKDARVDFTTVNAEMARVDVDDSKNSTAKAWRLSGGDSAFFREWFNTQPSEKRLSLCKGIIKQKLSKMNCVNDRELDEYIDRVIGTMSEDQLSELEQSPYPYVVKIQGKVKELIAEHRSGVFDTWLEQDKISCLPNYALPAVISPTAFTSMVPKSLYTAEEDMNEYEFKVVWALSALGNVKWWHRNISRLGFQINGPVHAYPDIIVLLNSGKVLMVETKGDHLDNDESKEKAKIGDQWAKLAGKQYKYYMVFETKQPDYPGAYSLERFMEIVKGL